MSREILYQNNRIQVIQGYDNIFGIFVQMYDNLFQNVTPEGEGIVFDWSSNKGIETNRTNIPLNQSTNQHQLLSVYDLINKYLDINNY